MLVCLAHMPFSHYTTSRWVLGAILAAQSVAYFAYHMCVCEMIQLCEMTASTGCKSAVGLSFVDARLLQVCMCMGIPVALLLSKYSRAQCPVWLQLVRKHGATLHIGTALTSHALKNCMSES